MASYFEEVGAFDRPFIPATVKVGGKDVPVAIRQISAAEQDSVDAFEMTEYGRLVQASNVSTDGLPSEFQRIVSIYKTRDVTEIAKQLLPQRNDQISKAAAEMADIDLGAEELKMIEMAPEERDAYTKVMDARLQEFQKAAEQKVIGDIIASDTFEGLCTRLAEINVNFKAQMKARRASNTHYLYHSMFRPNDLSSHVFDSVDDVRSYAQETLDGMSVVVREALSGDRDLPKTSPDAPASDKPSSLPDTSEVEAPTSGDSTLEAQAN